MADSANILSILSALGQASPDPAPVNVLQAAAPPPVDPAPVAPAAVVAPPPPVSAAPAPAAADEHPRKRLSVIDTIGRLADVFANVGGATPLYQPTLDAREDRTLALGDHERKVLADNVALATGKFDLGDKQNTRLGMVARGLKAIQSNGGDINQAWPILAQRMQLDPATTESVGHALATDPTALDGLIAATTDPKYDQSKYGGSVVYGQDANGNLVAYQPSLGNDGARSILPEGITPIDPVKFVDTGGSQVGYGTRSGRTQKVLPKSAKPDTVLTTTTSRENNIRDNQTRRYIADNRPGKTPTDNASFVQTAQGNLDELRGIYKTLNDMGAMVSPKRSAGANVEARLRASGLGQTVEGAIGTQAQTQRDRIASIRPQLMQSLAKATGMTGKQLDSNSDVKLFMQTVTNPASSYEANIKAIDGLERFLKANAKKPTAAPAGNSGWSIVGVK